MRGGPSNQQMIARPRTGHVKQMPLGVVDLFEIGVIGGGFDALLERDHFVVACHHDTARDFSRIAGRFSQIELNSGGGDRAQWRS